MSGGRPKVLRYSKTCLAGVLIVLILFSDIGIIPFTQLFIPNDAEAAQVSIDTSASSAGTSHLQSGGQTVFTGDQTGYKFYRDSGGTCVYSKTTNGGTSWGTAITVDSQTDCIGIQVWFDKWTPGLSTSFIHIVTMDSGNDDPWYNRLDPSSDTLLLGSSPVSTITNSGQAGSLTEGENFVSITRGTDGTIYVVSNDGTNPSRDSYIVECTTNCNLATSWTETGTNPLDVASDYNLIAPLASGNIMLINRDVSADVIRYKTWNNTSWSGVWTTIDASAPENSTYDVGMAVTTSSTTPGSLYLAYIANNATLGTDDVVRSAKFNGSTWSATTAVVPSTTYGLTNVSIAVNGSNDDVYVAYTGQTTAGTVGTGNVYWKWATSSMTNWSLEQGPVNTAANDMYGIDLSRSSDQRIYATWFEVTGATIFGDTLDDVFPGIHATTSGSQTVTAYAMTQNFYVGGAFVLTDNYKAHDVTGITITESGTISGSTNIANVKLLYEMDTTYPYNCESVSYGGGESQFGSTDANGFSGDDGVSSFTGTTVNVSTTTAMCVYVVFDILDNTLSGSNIDISIANPSIDITVSNFTSGPTSAQNIQGLTTVLNDYATLTHYHWRTDNGSESTASSTTSGVEDTPLTALPQETPRRLRVLISNEGGSSTPAFEYRLETASTTGACSSVTSWVDVGAAGGEFDMYDSPNLTDGTDTTNVLQSSLGAVTDPGGKTFLSPNGAVKDTSSQTGPLVLTSTQFVELEYSIVASTSATEGNTYCFRVSDKGTSLPAYSVYPRATIASDVTVTISTSTQISNASIPTSNVYFGGAFFIKENTGSRNVTNITITENGSVDASVGLENIKLYYDLDTTAPYNCASESYVGGELQFGATDADGFSAPNGTSTFSDNVTISTTQALCIYIVANVTLDAVNGETVNFLISDPSIDVVVTGGGSVSPKTPQDITSSTTLQGAILTQTHYHWRNDNGTEATSTSKTSGVEDTPITYAAQLTPVRLRLQVSNEGFATSPSAPFILEYGTKITSCENVVSWSRVNEPGAAFTLHDSVNLTDGDNTTDISNTLGGVSNPPGKTFKTPNSAVKDTSIDVATTTLTTTEFLETEYSIEPSLNAGYGITYCFRLAAGSRELEAYNVYAELTTSPRRDFEIQSNSFVMTGTTQTLNAGVDYNPPSASSSAFIRITNAHYTGAGDSGGAANQNADDVTVYIQNPSNIENSVTFVRTGATNDTQVSWEIVEFIGTPGSDNEMIVRGQSYVTYSTTEITATGTAVSGIVDDTDVVVFITGQMNPNTARTNYNLGQSTSAWDPTNDQPIFTRGDSGGEAVIVSYAVVEFTGPNWIIQRSEHTYTAAGTTETEPITSVGSLSRTFLHTQKRVGPGLNGMDEFGHEVWLSSVGYVSYFLESGATTPSAQTSVAWVIENTQITSGAMEVTSTAYDSTGGTSPILLSFSISKTLEDLTNASIFITSRGAGTTATFPSSLAGVYIASSTHYAVWRSNSTQKITFRTDIVEWPTAGLALRQNYYRFYVHNNALTPTDPWPEGATNIGENTVLTESDEPLGDGEKIRIRMTLNIKNATFPTSTRAFRLQYGLLETSCSAISELNWVTLGDSASSTVWRGVSATGTTDGTPLSGNPPSGGDLLLSVSLGAQDKAGTLEEENDSAVNPYSVPDGSDVEYDWIVEQNGAIAESYYCFRMINATGETLDGYLQYPQVRTASFTPKTQNWRWYDDETNETPTVFLESENVAPPDIANDQVIKLRVTVKEVKNIGKEDVRFKLQYSEYANFSIVHDVVATSSCVSTSTWCYTDVSDTDNGIITTKTLSDADACSGGVGDGCGTHNESPTYLLGHRHENHAAAEYEFTIESAYPRVNRVYYFRLYDLFYNIPVEPNTGNSYPSLVTEGAQLTFSVSGIPSGSLIEGVTTDIDTTPTSINFGTMPLDSFVEGAYRVAVDANGTEGYKLYMTMPNELLSTNGAELNQVSGTNAVPTSWNDGCAAVATSCFGYHTGDDTLEGGSARFAADDTWAHLSTTTLDEIAFSSQPVAGETTDIVFRLLVRQLQAAGLYETNITYVSVPVF